MNYRPSSWLDQLVGACLSLLVGAAAVFIAVSLIEAVWTVLVVILGVGALLVAAGMLLRGHRRGW